MSEEKDDKFTIQVSVLGGTEQFVASGTSAEVMAAFEPWMKMVETVRKDLIARRAELPPDGSGSAGSTTKAVTPFRRPS